MPQILAKRVTEYKHDYTFVAEGATVEQTAEIVGWPATAYTVYEADEMGPEGVLKTEWPDYKNSTEYVATSSPQSFPSGEM